MRVKTYRDRSLVKIIERLNEEFGNSYAILSVNNRWKWKFFIFPRREVEVIVSIEEKGREKKDTQEPVVSFYKPKVQGSKDELIESFLADLKKPQPVSKGKPLVFFGPTGSGKTTHIGKTYMDLLSSGFKDIVVVSFDTFRLGAIEQLKIFCSVVDTPFQVVYEPEEFRDIVELLSEHGVILVDTPGISVSSQNVEELVKFLEITETTNVLTIDASRDVEVLSKYLKTFSGLTDGIAITKLDEVDEKKWERLKELVEEYPVYSVSYRQNLTEGFKRLWR